MCIRDSGNINGGAQIFVNWFGLPLWLAQVIYYVIAGKMCIRDRGIPVDFFEEHREEVVEVSIYDYDEERTRKTLFEEAKEMCRDEVKAEVLSLIHILKATDSMVVYHITILMMAGISMLSQYLVQLVQLQLKIV